MDLVDLVAGHYLQGTFSPPTLKEETGKTLGYPCTGALSQYMTLMVPKPTGVQSHSHVTREEILGYVELVLQNKHNLIDYFSSLGKQETCNCTCDVFCPVLHANGRDGPVAAVPSRGNRHSQFLLMSTLPKNDLSLTYTLLKLQAGDLHVMNSIGRTDRQGSRINLDHLNINTGWDLNTKVPFTANVWSAKSSNVAFTPYSCRLLNRPANYLNDEKLWKPTRFNRSAKTMGAHNGHAADIPPKSVYNKNSINDIYNPSLGDNLVDQIHNKAVMDGQDGSVSRRLIDMMENATGTSPSTLNVGMFNPHVEGSRDVISCFATSIFTHRLSTYTVPQKEGLGSVPDSPL